MRTLFAEKPRNQDVRVPWAHLRLPPFPQIAIRVLQSANNENVPMRQLSDLISSDPAFSSEVLTIANSVLYAPRFPVTSILQAIAVLGTNNLKGLCLTVGVRAYLGKSLSHPSLRAIWRHNLACGLVAEHLAASGLMDKDAAYTAGIMHDIGRLALVVIRPAEYAALLGRHAGSSSSLLKEEKDLFGFDHCQAGRNLIRDWKLPSDFEAIVARHHSYTEPGDTWQTADVINMSCRMADTVGFAAFPGCETVAFETLREALPPRERGLLSADVESLAFEVGSKINAVESV
jgi:putative nucleotidyltransferase with HDIG domain